MLTAARLRELFHYDPDTGVFTRLVDLGSRARVGAVVGSFKADGYLQICVDRRKYTLHRLAWLYVTGEWPLTGVDHRDRDRSNNRWDNLRLASKSQNGHNTGLQARNTSGYKGVYFDRRRQKWVAQITIAGVCHHLGRHSSALKAGKVYEDAARRALGEFARAA